MLTFNSIRTNWLYTKYFRHIIERGNVMSLASSFLVRWALFRSGAASGGGGKCPPAPQKMTFKWTITLTLLRSCPSWHEKKKKTKKYSHNNPTYITESISLAPKKNIPVLISWKPLSHMVSPHHSHYSFIFSPPSFFFFPFQTSHNNSIHGPHINIIHNIT